MNTTSIPVAPARVPVRTRLRRTLRRRRRHIAITAVSIPVVGLLVFAIAWRCCPFPAARLDAWPASPMVTDRAGSPLLCVVGADDQWRLPLPLHDISPWLAQATVAVEDERFWSHHGVDPLAVVRAVGQNILSKRTVSGASTLTMQVCRMIDDRPRTLRAKLIESFRALQLEASRDKSAILESYLNLAPYGGNLRGAEAASNAYFRKHASDLSLGEAALLAGLPQAPSRYRPDRFPDRALARRRHVLERMWIAGFITREQLSAALAEPVMMPDVARRPVGTSQVAWLALKRRPAGGRTTVDPRVQQCVEEGIAGTIDDLPPGTQIAALAIDIASSQVVALVGSADRSPAAGGEVNGALALRSPGSTLKPFVYAAAFEAGVLAPDSIVQDVPVARGAWTPANFDRGFAGALPASEALRRSLNIPAILVAEGTGVARCLGTIQAAGVRLPADAQSRGGLAVVVGAVEVSLLDLVNAYATIGRGGAYAMPRLFADEPLRTSRAIHADVCAAIDDILSCRQRTPRGVDEDATDLAWFMWKTGTSSGRRDAWAVGHNGRYALGVWVGRFSGAGAAEYVGAEVAEPILTQLFQSDPLRAEIDPPAPPTLRVRRPMRMPRELADDLRILSPQAGARYVAIDGTVGVLPGASSGRGIRWFIDGRLVEPTTASPLRVGVGRHELRCADDGGRSAAVSFDVVAPAMPTRAPIATLRPVSCTQ